MRSYKAQLERLQRRLDAQLRPPVQVIEVCGEVPPGARVIACVNVDMERL